MTPTGTGINDIVSVELQVKPLEEGQFATYKLCDVDLKDFSHIDEATGKHKQCSPRRSMLGQISIRDPFANNKMKIIQNIVGTKYENDSAGLPREINKIERVNFPRSGALTVTHEHPGTYIYLERHPRNRDNPFRDKTKLPLFYRVNPKKHALIEMEKIYLKADALDWIKKANVTELNAIWMKLNPTAQASISKEPYEVMKRDMFKYADAYPDQILRASNNQEAKLRIQIMDAEYFNIIAFFDMDDVGLNKERYWVFTGEAHKKDDRIVTLDLNINKIDGLVQYLSDPKNKKEAVAAYQKMTAALKKILTPKELVATAKPKPVETVAGHEEDGSEIKRKVDVPV